jgi:cytochrome c peroxidase
VTHHRFRKDRHLAATPRPMHIHRAPFWAVAGAIVVLALTGCGGSDSTKQDDIVKGEKLFKTAFAGTNGRSCASCHVPEDNFTLTPGHVARLLETNPKDPLFNAIDADDPNAETLTYEHLKKGLIRVELTLPDNMDQIDAEGKVITPSNRKIAVWRGVPSIADVAMSGPYQLDGREPTLESQANGAFTGHSQGTTISANDLRLIAAFEKDVFSSDRARKTGALLAAGTPVEKIADLEASMVLATDEMRGRDVYKAVCASCHGGVTTNTIVNRTVHAQAFPQLKADGTVRYKVPVTGEPVPVLAAQPKNEYINIGSAIENFLAQLVKLTGIEATEHVSFTRELSYPKYRFRFYKDATKKEIIADLPPKLPSDPENPDNPLILLTDADGNFIVGPNFSAQLYTTDPGRAAITGNPYDFEAFDIPSLRGIGKTAPYWHNNISGDLAAVVELYSDHLLSKFPMLVQPGEKEKDQDGGDIGPEQTMTRQQKDDLLAYLKRL